VSRLRLGVRLVARDLQRRRTEAVLLFVALAVAASTMTIGLTLHGQTAAPYALTRARTAGPDIVAAIFPAPSRTATAADRARLRSIAERPGVATRSRPFPTTWASIDADGTSGVAEVQGRDASPSAVDSPLVVAGHWVGSGGVVVERAFAQAMGLSVGDSIVLGGTRERVSGIAISAALPPYPQLCTIGCILDHPAWFSAEPGLVWATRHRVTALASTREPLVWFQYLRLHDPGSAPAFALRHGAQGPPTGQAQLDTWQSVAARQAEQLAHERTAVAFGSTLLVILALATLVVLVGGRLGDEVRRVGTLKAAGAGPGFVAGLLLTSYLVIGLAAAMVGLVSGQLLTPRLVGVSAGLLGREGATTLTPTDAVVVVGSLLAVVMLATTVPAWRAARTSTVQALRDRGRLPRRHRVVVGLSARLPAAGLLGLRLAARRPRRTALTSLSIATVVCAGVVVLFAQSRLHAEHGNAGGPADPQVAQLQTVTTALTLLLAVMAAVNLLFVTRASAVDARRMLALARAVGISPSQAAAAVGLGQLFPALVGIAVGGATGSALFHALSTSRAVAPPTTQLVALAVITLLVTVCLTAFPALLEARRPIAEMLREA
jgi:ABC-type lipoprotein release transport system permease subunit